MIDWFKHNFHPIDQTAPWPVNTGSESKDSFNRMRNRWNLIYAGPVVRNWALLTFILFVFTDLSSTAIPNGGVVAVIVWLACSFAAFLSVIFTSLWFSLWWSNGFNRSE